MVEPIVKSEQQQGDLFLPPGFRFHPTDEEIITSYLLQKFLNPSFTSRAVGEADLNKCEPWDLPSKAKMGEKEWYFFCHKDMKYPTGTRTNRATEAGYWKATGKDREIFKPPSSSSGGARELVGMKKTLVFYTGRAPRGSKTNWVMHEYRLHGKSRDSNANLRFNRKDEWVVSKVLHKKGEANNKQLAAVEYSAGTPNVSSVEAAEDDKFVDSMIEPMYFNSTSSAPNTTTSNAVVAPYNVDYSIPSTAGATANTSSFADVPNYCFMNDTTSNSSWNMLHADHAMGLGGYSLHHQQAIIVKALGGVVSQNFACGGLQSSAAAVTGVSQQNSLGAHYGYGGSYATDLTSSAATAAIGAAAKSLGDPVARY